MVYINYLSYNVFLLKVGGLYKIDESNNRGRYLCGYIPRIFFNLLLAVGCVATAYEIFRKSVFNFTSNAMGYVTLGTIVCNLLRSIYFCLYDNKTKNLVDKANALFKYETQTLLVEKNMKQRLNMTNRLTWIWLIYIEVACCVFTVYPFYTGMWKSRILAFPMWLPYDWNVSPFYKITCAMQVVFALLVGWLLCAVDGFFSAVFLLTAEQFKLLGWEVKNLLFTNLVLCGISEEKIYEFQQQFNEDADERKCNKAYFGAMYELCDSQRFDENMVRHSKKLIAFHQSLLLFCADLEDFFSPLMLILYSFFIRITFFFNFIIISTNSTSLLLQYLLPSLGTYVELLFPCLIASVFTTEVENLQKELYEMPWYMCGRRFKTNYKLLLHGVNMPVTLTVGKFSNLNLPFFLWAARTINSYCIILYQFYRPERSDI